MLHVYYDVIQYPAHCRFSTSLELDLNMIYFLHYKVKYIPFSVPIEFLFENCCLSDEINLFYRLNNFILELQNILHIPLELESIKKSRGFKCYRGQNLISHYTVAYTSIIVIIFANLVQHCTRIIPT